MIEREVFSWGVRLTVRPFTAGEHQSLTIQSEISHYKRGRGSDIRITFPGVSVVPLRIVDAQTWREALGAIIDETRSVAGEMKTESAKLAAKPKSAKLKPKPAKRGR